MTKKYFPKPINNTDKFFEKLEENGKSKTLNSSEYIERQNRMNEGMAEVRRDFLRRDAGSIISARDFYIWHTRNYSFY